MADLKPDNPYAPDRFPDPNKRVEFPPEAKAHFDYILTLWRQGLNEKYPTRLFRHEGYDFGRVTVAPDDSAVAFSLISNSAFDKVDPEVQIVAVPMKGGQPQWIAVGGKPAFGKGPFIAIPATDNTSLSNPVGCPKGFVGRLNVGQRAKVSSGYVSNLRKRPIDGAIVSTLPSGSVFLVLDGPRCAADGRVWWKVNYQGTVGGTLTINQATPVIIWPPPQIGTMAANFSG